MKQANYKMKVLNLTCIFNAYVVRNLHDFFIFHILSFPVAVVCLFVFRPKPIQIIIFVHNTISAPLGSTLFYC